MRESMRIRAARTRRGDLSPALQALDRDLRAIAIEERSSFGVELKARLLEECGRIQAASPRRASWARRSVASGAVILVVLGILAAPSTRAGLAWLFGPSPALEAKDPPPLPASSIVVTEAFTEAEAAAEPARVAPYRFADGAPPREFLAPRATLPALLDPDQARRVVAREYPRRLQRVGVGGTVNVLLWAQPDGGAGQARVAESSGVEGLDSAAMRAVRSFLFRPATHGGRPVGTWVQFSIRFRPHAPDSPLDTEYRAFHIPLSN